VVCGRAPPRVPLALQPRIRRADEGKLGLSLGLSQPLAEELALISARAFELPSQQANVATKPAVPLLRLGHRAEVHGEKRIASSGDYPRSGRARNPPTPTGVGKVS
jgi:hypothetical protein